MNSGAFYEMSPFRHARLNRAEKTWRWCRRNPALASSIASALLLLLVVAIGSPIAMLRIDGETKAR